MAKTIAEQYAQRLRNLIDDMRDDRMTCYELLENDHPYHYIQFGDGSVIVEPEIDDDDYFDADEWCELERQVTAIECGHTSEDEKATAVLKASL